MDVTLSQNKSSEKKSTIDIYSLVLSLLPGVGPKTHAKLLSKFPEKNTAFKASQTTLEALGFTPELCTALKNPPWDLVEATLDWAENPNHHLISLGDKHYSALLKEIPNPPPFLYGVGQITLLNSPQLALIGSRNPTALGKETAKAFAYSLGELGVTITSGLALGIDAASHEGALEAKGPTIAVLGTGVDKVYPAQHKILAHRIGENGLLLSEFPLGTTPQSQHFPQRNRIISGLSMGVLVVEATLRSGSLITASYALEQGREVFAIPGAINNPLAKGCHRLIRQGATLVESLEDILEELQGMKTFSSLILSKQEQNVVENIDDSVSVDKKVPDLVQCIDFSCTPVDIIIARSNRMPQSVASELLHLELEGYIKSIAGGYIRLR